MPISGRAPLPTPYDPFPNGMAPTSRFGGLYQPGQTGGGTKANRIEDTGRAADQNWANLGGDVPDTVNLSYGPGGDINPYTNGPSESPTAERFLAPAGAGYAPGSRAGKMAGVGGMAGPGAVTPESQGLAGRSSLVGGKSAFGDMTYDPGSEAGQRAAGDYFQNLSGTGSDPIAEADYQKRAAQAEQSRKANTDAALQQLEMKGQGNAGGNLTAMLAGAQGVAGDRYQAGLDTTAAAAQRRDAAAASGAGVFSQLGNNITQNQTARNSGVDQYGLDAGKTIDAWNGQRIADWHKTEANNAAAATAANQHNTTRAQTVGDTNTGLGNDTSTFNKVQAPQTRFQNMTTVTGGLSGSQHDSANTLAGINHPSNPLDTAGKITDMTGQVVGGVKKLATL